MQDIRPTSSSATLGSGRTGAAERLAPERRTVALPAPKAAGAPAAPLRRGLSNWDHQLQGEIASAQRTAAFFQQSAGQLQQLKGELAGRLSARLGGDGQLEVRLRQFSQAWRTRPPAPGAAEDDVRTIAPERWNSADVPAARQTLQQVLQALTLVQRARDSADATLAATAGRVDALQPAETAAGMQRLAQDFAATANQPGYESLLSISSALSGISRDRVQSLLRLR
jgi:hypothetical protein